MPVGSASQAVCVVDVGTTRTKVALVDAQGALRALATAATPGALLGDPDRAWDADALPGVVGGLLGRVRQDVEGDFAVAGLCVTGQRASFLARDGNGEALAALSWQDVRAASEVDALLADMDAARYQRITGLPPNPVSTLIRLRWWRRRHPARARALHRVSLVSDALLVALGGERTIDPSNASATGLWDLSQGRWSDALLDLAGLSPDALPDVASAGSSVGALDVAAARVLSLPVGTPLLLAGGDQACAALGMGVVRPGQAGLCLGTAADVLCPVSGVADPLPGRLCTAHVVEGMTLLEGFLGAFGASLDWGRRLLAKEEGPGEVVMEESREDPGVDDPFYLPFLTGIGSPEFDPEMRGALLGLTPAHGPAVVWRAVQEGLALELRRILESSALPAGVLEIVASGGAARMPGLLPRLARTTGRSVSAHASAEATLLGAACLAWYGLGRYGSAVEAAEALASETISRLAAGRVDGVGQERFERYCRWVDRLRGRRAIAP